MKPPAYGRLLPFQGSRAWCWAESEGKTDGCRQQRLNFNYLKQRCKFIGSHYLEIRHCWIQFLCLSSLHISSSLCVLVPLSYCRNSYSAGGKGSNNTPTRTPVSQFCTSWSKRREIKFLFSAGVAWVLRVDTPTDPARPTCLPPGPVYLVWAQDRIIVL